MKSQALTRVRFDRQQTVHLQSVRQKERMKPEEAFLLQKQLLARAAMPKLDKPRRACHEGNKSISDTILLVEDGESNVEFFMMAAKQVRFTNPIQIITDGQRAIDYFNGTGKFSNREEFPLPALVLLDLRLPYQMGMVVLKWLRKQAKFKSTIVIVFTSSENASDISKAYEEGANAYLVKPPTLEGLGSLIRNLKNFGLAADLPRQKKIGEQLKTHSVFGILATDGQVARSRRTTV